MARYKVEMEILSPFHIGGEGRELGTMEFLRDREWVYLINEDRLVRALNDEGLTAGFLSYLGGDYRPNLFRFFQSLPRRKAESLRAAISSRRIKHKIKGHFFSLRPQQWDMVGNRPVIPGSAVKGALRNLILYLYCTEDEALRKGAAKAVANRNNPKTVARFLEEDVFSQAHIPGARQGPHRDWFRTLQISDFHTEDPDCTEVVEVKVVSLNKEKGFHFSLDRRDRRGERQVSVFLETIAPGTIFTGTITFPPFLQGLFRAFPGGRGIFTPLELFSRLKEKTAALLTEERVFFQHAGLKGVVDDLLGLEGRGANLRLGWGTGLLTMTISQALRGQERLNLGQKFYKARHPGVFPRSRKVVMQEGIEPCTTLGWVKVQISPAD
ncbi:MAG: type III-A CRISPR-associated RAMP protein Csm5 [Firmicutes bacterium]|nr:type III-A CRISPR-associated RAMP protein Csm5 [Bacillota bacterium]